MWISFLSPKTAKNNAIQTHTPGTSIVKTKVLSEEFLLSHAYNKINANANGDV